jgi:hypothetical protein
MERFSPYVKAPEAINSEESQYIPAPNSNSRVNVPQNTCHQSGYFSLIRVTAIRREGHEQDQAQEASSHKAICDDDG